MAVAQTVSERDSKPFRFSVLMGDLMNDGMSKKSAEKITESFEVVYEHQAATRQDLKNTEIALRGDIKQTEARLQMEMKETEARLQMEMKEIESRLHAEIKETKVEIIKWVAGMFFVQTFALIGGVVAALKLISG